MFCESSENSLPVMYNMYGLFSLKICEKCVRTSKIRQILEIFRWNASKSTYQLKDFSLPGYKLALSYTFTYTSRTPLPVFKIAGYFSECLTCQINGNNKIVRWNIFQNFSKVWHILNHQGYRNGSEQLFFHLIVRIYLEDC